MDVLKTIEILISFIKLFLNKKNNTDRYISVIFINVIK